MRSSFEEHETATADNNVKARALKIDIFILSNFGISKVTNSL